ncbi:uncharacterized protein LOC106179307 isoform X1 [Lingula anatina]|uniref:Uncharacterized protein LOC106179307 isoform X1 n=2 Tax=Lingula anatina TaxID=7574 RepID=A0A1S3K6R6_LINAN|nr:uncharacterized protein LOC106179307 isoform X1 [Lingula anatina]|eukprot:XP_013418330.1 uncharacterized protein LOC106179307 isoform X1 [Lingula anatina]
MRKMFGGSLVLHLSALLTLHLVEGEEPSPTPPSPVIAPECPFFKAQTPKILGSKFKVEFSLVTTAINSSRTFKDELFHSQDVIQGKVVDYRMGNVTVGAKGTCLTCDATCSSCDVTLAIGGYVEPGVTQYILPQHYYDVDLICVVKHNVPALTYRALPARITLATTCDFSHVRPNAEYIFTGRVTTLSPKLNFELKYAYKMLDEKVELLRQLCGFRSPEISPTLADYSQCSTYGTDPDMPCEAVAAASISRIAYIASVFPITFTLYTFCYSSINCRFI